MKIVVKTTNIELTPPLRNFIEEKINSLEKYYNHFDKETPKVEAYLEIGKETKHHKKGVIFLADCQLIFPEKVLKAVAKKENLKSAILEVKDELKRQLKGYKERLKAKTKRESRVLKKELKISPQARFYRKGRIREEGI